MGCRCSGPRDVEEIDREVLANFLQNKENLLSIWKQFNKNEDDVIDRGEFDRLLFSALQIFCKERDPDMPSPTRETLDPFIEKLRNELAPRIDTDGDGVISFEEFKTFGEYLKQEYSKLHTQNAANAARRISTVSAGGLSTSAGNIAANAGGVDVNSNNANTNSYFNSNNITRTNTKINPTTNANTNVDVNPNVDRNIDANTNDKNNVNLLNEFTSSMYGAGANPVTVAGSIAGVVGGLPTGTETVAMNSKNVTNNPDIASANVDTPISNNDGNVAQ